MRPTTANQVARPSRSRPPRGARMDRRHAGKHKQTYESRERAERHPAIFQALRESRLTGRNDPNPVTSRLGCRNGSET